MLVYQRVTFRNNQQAKIMPNLKYGIWLIRDFMENRIYPLVIVNIAVEKKTRSLIDSSSN